jgi:hypothetical protein
MFYMFYVYNIYTNRCQSRLGIADYAILIVVKATATL